MFQFDKKLLAAALLHPQYRKLTFVDNYERGKIHDYVRRLLVELQSDVTNIEQSTSTADHLEPKKKKHKSIEDQQIDPDESYDEALPFTQLSVVQKCDELEKYMRTIIDD